MYTRRQDKPADPSAWQNAVARHLTVHIWCLDTDVRVRIEPLYTTGVFSFASSGNADSIERLALWGQFLCSSPLARTRFGGGRRG